MVPHSLQLVHVTLQALPVAVSIASTSISAAEQPQKAKIAKETGEVVPPDVRATKITSLLAHIQGYDHSGLNE